MNQLQKRHCCVYAIRDGRTGPIMYIGCTSRPLTRISGHFTNDASPVYQWAIGAKAVPLVHVMAGFRRRPEALAVEGLAIAKYAPPLNTSIPAIAPYLRDKLAGVVDTLEYAPAFPAGWFDIARSWT